MKIIYRNIMNKCKGYILALQRVNLHLMILHFKMQLEKKANNFPYVVPLEPLLQHREIEKSKLPDKGFIGWVADSFSYYFISTLAVASTSLIDTAF